MTTLTQKWVNGTATNNGVVLWATNETTNGYDLRFRSSENTPTNERPYLEVTWSQIPRTVYFLKDHLGSIRATVQDTSTAPVCGYDDYDPWGYILAGRSVNSVCGPTSTVTRNKFTGKEWDDEFGVNWNYFGARYYDPQIGRWMSMDPLMVDYPGWSPYNYSLNNPIRLYDPDGNGVKDRIKGIIAVGVTTSAEYANRLYNRAAGVAGRYPDLINYTNAVVGLAAQGAGLVTDLNPRTMGWADLTNLWLFELGRDAEIAFGADAAITQDLMGQEGVLEAREMALNRIAEGNFESFDNPWTYGQKAFYECLSEGNLATSFLGSYITR